LLGMSLLPCCRYHPAGIEQTNASLVCLYCLRPQIAGSASRVFRLRGHLCVYLRYGLVTCSSPFIVTLSIDFRGSVTLLSAIQATGLLALTLTGLTPAEHTSLSWTYNTVRKFVSQGHHLKTLINIKIFTAVRILPGQPFRTNFRLSTNKGGHDVPKQHKAFYCLYSNII